MSNPCSRRAPLSRIPRPMSRQLEISRKETPQPCWTTCASALTPAWNSSCFLESEGTSYVPVCAYCLWTSLRRAWLDLFCSLLSDIHYIHWWVHPWAFLPPGWSVLALTGELLQSLDHHGGPLLDSSQYSKSLLHWWGLELDTRLQVVVQLQCPRQAVTLLTVFMLNTQRQYTYLSLLEKEGMLVML